MRYALISDIHACPNEVVVRLQSRGIAGAAGNHDSTVATRRFLAALPFSLALRPLGGQTMAGAQ